MNEDLNADRKKTPFGHLSSVTLKITIAIMFMWDSGDPGCDHSRAVLSLGDVCCVGGKVIVVRITLHYWKEIIFAFSIALHIVTRNVVHIL